MTPSEAGPVMRALMRAEAQLLLETVDVDRATRIDNRADEQPRE